MGETLSASRARGECERKRNDLKRTLDVQLFQELLENFIISLLFFRRVCLFVYRFILRVLLLRIVVVEKCRLKKRLPTRRNRRFLRSRRCRATETHVVRGIRKRASSLVICVLMLLLLLPASRCRCPGRHRAR